MLTYSFTNLGSESLYEHLYNCIKNDILSGKLTGGFKLPSKRTFAKNLGISTITVENAYLKLISEGYIYSIQKKGYFVSDIKSLETYVPKLEPDIKVSESKNYKAQFSDKTALHTLFPFATWAKLMREVISEKSVELMTPSPPGGIAELRLAISEYLYQFRGMNVSPEQIIIGAGTEYLYGLIIQLLGHDKIFAVEDPGYSKISKVYRSNNAECEYIPIDKSGLSIDVLKKSSADIIHISPSHHFPTGIVTPVSRRYELLSWASKEDGRYIIEDDYDSEFRLVGHPLPTLRSIDVTDKVIYMNTFTKTLASTIRISYMVLPNTLVEKFYRELGFYSCTVSTFEQYTLSKFISEGFFSNHINRMRKYYRDVRDELLKNIRDNPAFNSAKITEEDAGLHFLLTMNTEIHDREFVDGARQRGINISGLAAYYHNVEEVPIHTFVMNYSGINRDDIKNAVEELGNIIKRPKKILKVEV